MSAHRPSAPWGETVSRNRPADHRGRRRATRGRRATPARRGRTSHAVLPLLVCVGLLAAGAVAGPDVIGIGSDKPPVPGARDRIALASIPSDNPELGLVYSGLEPAERDSPCAGAYRMADPQTCTHGPELPPSGVAVHRNVAPVTGPAADPGTPRRESGEPPSDAEIIRDEGGTALVADQPALVPDAAPGEAGIVLGTHDVACAGDGRTGKRAQVLYLHEAGTPSRYADYLGSIRTWSA
ncbi:MAG TPA: hypothetical protein VFO77_16865, partial [Actinoplanes sp.]|nr:hypothetical protein [Actinoplanes sp.]